MWDSMLGKGFKAQKCKTLLRLAMARIKLLRNKREIQLKQMRKEISQLLTTGQEPSARIRVEHIIREQNILAAYDILELFCELVAVRLPVIESQKTCPLDLKEAIASLIFASPRCSDLPELLQIRQLFAAKYGKEFVAAAADLRPECGVNRRIIEKLSVRAPSGEVKLKLMKEIAAEYDVDWDPADTEKELLKSHEDLLHGSNHLLGADELQSSQFSSSQPTGASDATTDVPTITMSQMPADLDGLSSSSSPYEGEKQQNVPPPTKYEAPSPVQFGPPSPKVPPVRKVGTVDQASYGERQDMSSNDTGRDTYLSTRRDDHDDYSDVASAAQAAAEAANRAVAAARAAANLARKQSGDYSARVPEKTASPPTEAEESSATDLDSDDEEEERNVPVKPSGIRRQFVPESRKPAPAPAPAPANFSDSDSDTAEYDAPRGRGAGGTKTRSNSAYERTEAPEPYGKQKHPLKATKLDFQTSDASSKIESDGEDDGEGSVLFRSGKQEPENRGSRTPRSNKGGVLKWKSRDDPESPVPRDDHERYVSRGDPERYDIFDANSDKTTLQYSAFDSSDHGYDKKEADYDPIRPEETYASYDQPFPAKPYSSKIGSRSREGSPLFDEERSVGRGAREPSRLGSFPRTSHFDDEDEHDSSFFSGAQKYGSDDYSSHRDLSPRSVDGNDLMARYEALKPRRSR